MISIQCGECSKSYKVKPEMAGKKAKCKCGASILIPRPQKKRGTGTSTRKKKSKPKPASDSWDEEAWDDDLGGDDLGGDDFGGDDFNDYEADDDFGDGYDDQPRRPQRAGSSSGRKKSRKSGGRSKKGRKKRAGSGYSTMQIVGMVFGGVAALGLLIGLVVAPIGLITAGGIIIVCAALSIGGSLRCLIAAFEEDVICGIMWMFVPFYSWYYIITRFSELAQYLLIAIGGIIGMFIGMGYLSLLGSM